MQFGPHRPVCVQRYCTKIENYHAPARRTSGQRSRQKVVSSRRLRTGARPSVNADCVVTIHELINGLSFIFHYLSSSAYCFLYLPISCPSSRIWPYIALSRSCLVALPGRLSSVLSA